MFVLPEKYDMLLVFFAAVQALLEITVSTQPILAAACLV